MSIGTIILLGAFAGLTIFLGLPLAFLKKISPSLRIFLCMFATGVLLFLLYDVIQKASEPINAAIEQVRTQHIGSGTLYLDILLLVFGVGIGSVGLVYFNKLAFGRIRKQKIVPVETTPAAQPPQEFTLPGKGAHELSTTLSVTATAVLTPPATSAVPQGELAPHTLALLIATGIGLHNFSEGLAIGQSAGRGEIAFAVLLIVGFSLHNATEGFGIVGPLVGGDRPSWAFLGLAGLIGGGPTFLGTIVGYYFLSSAMFVLFLSLAAGALVYIIGELLHINRRPGTKYQAGMGLFVGFVFGYLTDLILTMAGV